MIPTEPVGSIPRPPALIDAVACSDNDDPRLDPLYEDAIRDTIARFEATGSPVITDGEQRKYHNFWTYSVQGLPNTAPDGFRIPFTAGHTRRMPRLTAGPFRYRRYADSYLDVAKRYAHAPLKQAVISPSALSLMYPRRRHCRATRATSSSTICSRSTRRRSGAASRRAPTRCRSISPRDAWR